MAILGKPQGIFDLNNSDISVGSFLLRHDICEILTVAALLVVWLVPFEAQGAPADGAGFVESREGKIEATGLTAVFPEDHICEPISSPFASPFRYDGSRRREVRHGGLHGGMDLTLEEGTPLLAVASGKVIAKGVGGRLEGIYLWLMHAPSDTGLPFWIYTKYQHLSDMPLLNDGDKVHAGQVIALSGKTGTTGGHYKSAGYPHLHLSVHMGPSNEYVTTGIYGSIIKALDAKLSDPLIIYLPQIKDLTSIASLPEDRKRVNIPIVSDNGSIHPQGSKVVWPVRCIAQREELKPDCSTWNNYKIKSCHNDQKEFITNLANWYDIM